MKKALLAFDTDHIKRYVFVTGKLKEIRGASRILDDLNRKEMEKLVDGEKVYAHGGSGLFIVEETKAGEAITKVKNAYSDKTAGAANLSAAVVEMPDNFDFNNDNIQPYWKLLSRKLELAKNQILIPRTMTTFPILRYCDSCGENPASNDKHGGRICPVCLEKRERNYSVRRREDLADNFGEIGMFSDPKNYFALLYADGDGFGFEIEKLSNLPQIRQFAIEVDRTLRESAKSATGHITKKEFDTLLQGGDDLVMALPAQYALKVAYDIVTGFSQRIQKSLKSELSISAAIVWAHVKYPFVNFLDLTESALRFAKLVRASRSEGGLINFLVVSNANHVDFESFYKQELTFNSHDQKVIRTMRPYSPESLRQLLDIRNDDKFSKAPRSKIQQLRQAVFQPSLPQSILDAITTLSHWRDQEQRKYFMTLPSIFFPEAQPAIFPWALHEGRPHTPFADLAEIYDFTRGEDDAA